MGSLGKFQLVKLREHSLVSSDSLTPDLIRDAMPSKENFMYSIKFFINKLPKSLNVKLRSHYFELDKENKNWSFLINLAVYGKKPDKPLNKARIKVIRYCKKYLDYDGFVGSLKPVIDSLVKAELIIDDNWNVLKDWDLDQIISKDKLGLEIELQEIE